MRNVLWTAILTGTAVVLVGSYAVITYMARNPVTPSMPTQNTVTPSTVDAMKIGNPLLTADKEAVSRWFPSFCFAELYVNSPSFGGKLVPNCVQQVIQQVKAETDVSLTEEDILSPEVIAHFKKIYGANNPWRR